MSGHSTGGGGGGGGGAGVGVGVGLVVGAATGAGAAGAPHAVSATAASSAAASRRPRRPRRPCARAAVGGTDGSPVGGTTGGRAVVRGTLGPSTVPTAAALRRRRDRVAAVTRLRCGRAPAA
ncbi:hypothetical protein E9529_06825 [Blastococcus sp. KM273128]|nr:hypothetical protein [Blastococcus sp. KM273128]